MKLNKYKPHLNRHAPYSCSVLLQDFALVVLSKQSLPLEYCVIWYCPLFQFHKKLVYLFASLPHTEKIRKLAHPGIFDTVYNSALKSGLFPTRWRVAQLVLLQKSGQPVGDPTSIWPHYMLGTIKKTFEQPIAKRLTNHFRGKCTLSTDQYGFWAGFCMIDAGLEG